MNDVPAVSSFRRVAVIDIGASSVRMQLAEVFDDGRITKLGAYSQAVSLGRDSFSKGAIARSTMEDCVNVLKIYREILEENRIDIAKNVRVVATSGLNEASNRLAFQDRVSIATGLEIEPFDAAELHRVTFLGLHPFMERHPDLFDGDIAVCEVGGGTTEFLFLKNCDIHFFRTFRLGSLRLRGSLESADAEPGRMQKLLEARIDSAVLQIQHLVHDKTAGYVAMGGDIRFAASRIASQVQPDQLTAIETSKLERFTSQILQFEPEQIAARYRLSLPEAQSLGPALLTHTTLARRFGTPMVQVAPTNLRDSLIREFSPLPGLSHPVDAQIVRSAEMLGAKYDVDPKHATQVAQLACALFEQLEPLHRLPSRYRIVIHLAAQLSEVGLFVNSRSHHKHAMYVILNSELFGVSRQDQELIALVVRYHRRATPQPGHEIYSTLSRENRIAVAKLASILRVAKALDASRTQQLSLASVEILPRRLRITTEGARDVSSEQIELKQDGQMFEDLFGIRLELVPGAIAETHD